MVREAGRTRKSDPPSMIVRRKSVVCPKFGTPFAVGESYTSPNVAANEPYNSLINFDFLGWHVACFGWVGAKVRQEIRANASFNDTRIAAGLLAVGLRDERT